MRNFMDLAILWIWRSYKTAQLYFNKTGLCAPPEKGGTPYTHVQNLRMAYKEPVTTRYPHSSSTMGVKDSRNYMNLKPKFRVVTVHPHKFFKAIHYPH